MLDGELAGRYRVLSILGNGGMGQVHLAHDAVLARKVAIKLLPDAVQHDRQARERFRREALAAAALDHPYICKIHEVGEHDGRSFIVMEYIEGRTLDRVTRDGDLSPRQWFDCATRSSRRSKRRIDAAWYIAISNRRTSCSRCMAT